MTETETIQRVIEVTRRQHKALATERVYIHWIVRYMRAIRQMPNVLPSEQKMERFLTELAVKYDVSASTQNQAFNAILFLYRDVLGVHLKNVDAFRATRPDRIRLAPNPYDTARILDAVLDTPGYPNNLVARLIYGCGLRVSEPLSLRLKDLNFEDSKLYILGAKHGRDRVVRIPCSLIERLDEQTKIAKLVAARDLQLRIPVQLPHQLAKKYPALQFDDGWAWLFPLRHPCKDPRDGRIVRWHMLTDTVQRAVKLASRKIGVFISPHHLRHAYATHSVDRGVNMKALQQAMGHKHIDTTAGYCHAEALSVPSPLDAVMPIR